MFGPAALALLWLLLLAGAFAHQLLLTLLTAALLLAAALSHVWKRYCLVGVEYRRRLSRHQVPFGETIEMEVEIVNRKLLPLAWLRIADELPAPVRPTRGRVYPSHRAGRVVLDSVVALRPFERVRRRHPLPCVQRGEYEVGPVRLASGDLFGLVTEETELDRRDTFVVWPRIVSLADLGLPARQPLGDRRIESWLHEDATRVAGAREYQPGDPQRRIHWPASVRARRLLSKVYEPTTSHRLVVLLNLHTAEQWVAGTNDPEAVELCIMVAASIASWAIEAGYQVGLIANGMSRQGGLDLQVPPAAGLGQRHRLLDALGRLQPFAVRPFEATLVKVAPSLRFGTTVVAVCAAVSAAEAAQLAALRRRGHQTVLVYTGAGAIGGQHALRGAAIRRVDPTGGWRAMPAISPAMV